MNCSGEQINKTSYLELGLFGLGMCPKYLNNQSNSVKHRLAPCSLHSCRQAQLCKPNDLCTWRCGTTFPSHLRLQETDKYSCTSRQSKSFDSKHQPDPSACLEVALLYTRQGCIHKDCIQLLLQDLQDHEKMKSWAPTTYILVAHNYKHNKEIQFHHLTRTRLS